MLIGAFEVLLHLRGEDMPRLPVLWNCATISPSLPSPSVLRALAQSFKYVGMEITWVGEGVEEYGHVKDDPENVVVKVDPRYFRPTEVELLLVRDRSFRRERLPYVDFGT